MIVFGWNDNGSYSFTDDWAKVPTAFKDIAGSAEIDGLENYKRFTKDDYPFTPQELDEADEILVEEALETAEEIEEVVVDVRRRKRHRSDR
jgi:hypothetical protein